MACCEYVKLKDDIDWGRMEIECILDLPQTPGRQGTETVQSSLTVQYSTVIINRVPSPFPILPK